MDIFKIIGNLFIGLLQGKPEIKIEIPFDPPKEENHEEE